MKSSTKYQKKAKIGWFLEGGTYTCQISTWVYAHLSLVLKLFKELTLAYNCGFLKSENVKEPLILCQFFHDSCWFFKVSEISGTNGSLILKTLQRTRTSGSLILEYSKNHTTLEKCGVGFVYPFQYMIYHLSKGVQASKISHKDKGNI